MALEGIGQRPEERDRSLDLSVKSHKSMLLWYSPTNKALVAVEVTKWFDCAATHIITEIFHYEWALTLNTPYSAVVLW